MPTTRRTMTWILAAVITALLLVPLLVLVTTVDDWSRDLTTNTAQTSDDAIDPQLRPLQLPATFDQIDQAARAIAAANADWEYVEADRADRGGIIHLVHVTGLMKFRDDVTLTVGNSVAGESIVRMQSGSRIGRGDLGQNPRNIKELRSKLQQRFGGA